MSEGDVSLIRDEDLLRRMWQQTEDFSRKKEIRAHMYRLREERLRSLYTPQPTIDGKGCEFTPAQSHVRSFADQTFQSMKSKEVRDAASPPKELVYRGQDLKALSNAGWNVESENRTTDDGHTRVRTVQANIEGKYDVEGGKGQFAAIDKQKQSATEYHDDNSSLKRNESSSVTAAHEQVQRQTDDGTQFSSTTSSSTSTSKFKQVSSSRNETVPYATNNDNDISRQKSYDTNTNVEESTKKYTSTSDYEQNLRKTDYNQAELVSRKIEYPDENTKVVVETRRLPDGTRVTSTRREFRAPPVQSSHTEQHSKQFRSENQSSFTSSSQKRSDIRETSSNILRESVDHRTDRKNIVDSQRISDDRDFHKNFSNYDDVELHKIVDDQDVKRTEYIDRHTYNINDSKKTVDDTVDKTYIRRRADDYDLNKNERSEYYKTQKDDRSEIVQKQTQKQNTYESKITETDRKVIDKTIHTNRQIIDTDHQRVDKDHQRIDIEHQIIDNDRQRINVDHKTTDRDVKTPDTSNRRKVTPSRDDVTLKEIKITKEIKEADDKNTSKIIKDIQQKAHNITDDKNIEEVIEKKTTYQTDYVQKKISTDLSPTHQAWASTLRSDTPSTTRPSTRASSPGSRTFISSTSSLRSSVSPDKTYKKPNSRGGSPNKYDRTSPRTSPDRYTGTRHTLSETRTHSYTSPNRKVPRTCSPSRSSASPDRKPEDGYQPRSKENPEKHPIHKHRPTASPDRKSTVTSTEDLNKSSHRSSQSPDTKLKSNYPRAISPSKVSTRISVSPEKKPRDQQRSIRTTPDKSTSGKPPVVPQSVKPTTSITRLSTSPDRKPAQRESSSPSRISPERTEKKYAKISDFGNLPTDATNATPDGKRTSPIKDSNNDRNSSVKLSQISESKTQHHGKISSTKVKEDHYKFVDEETKMYTLTEKKDTTNNKSETFIPGDNFPHQELPLSPSKETPAESQSTVKRSTLKKDSRSPSPSKSSVTFTPDGRRTQVDETDYQSIVTDERKNIINHYQAPKENYSQKVTPKDTKPNREFSPPKYGTYDKKRHTEVADTTITATNDDEKDKYDSSTNRKTSIEQPRSPSKKSPRDSISPVKSTTKETKYSHMTDFINTERRNEEIDKKITTKDRPRQLVTPSTSPTRKPKAVQKAPSTGQSSPTTSVSGFVYFSSPRRENRIVSDLDDQYYYSETDKTEGTRSTIEDITPVDSNKMPIKLPCRSPSPEKGTSPVKENLPRKSSLKKPSNNIISVSPSEQPPTNFKVSPSNESVDFPEQIIVKKDNPDNIETDSAVKPKPPFERRETYEERCKKILGMVDDDVITKVDQHSPSISPCRSPAPIEDSLLKSNLDKTSVINQSSLNDFIKRERENVKKISDRPVQETQKTHPRETSPTKLQDIFLQKLRDGKEEEEVNAKTSETIKSEKRTPSKTITKTAQYSIEENEPLDDTPKHSYPASTEESKHSRSPSPNKRVSKTTKHTEEYVYLTREPSDDTPKYSSPTRKPEEPKQSRTPSPTKKVTKTTEYSTEDEVYSTRKIPRELSDDTPKYSSPARKPEEPKHSRTPSPTKTVTKSTEYSTEENEYSTSKIRREPSDHSPKYSSPAGKKEEPKHSRTPSPTKTLTKTTEYSTEENKYSTSKIRREPSDQTPKYSSPSRKPEEPKHSRTPSPTKTVTKTTEYSTEEEVHSTRKTPREPSDDTPKYSSPSRKPEEPKHSRTPSPTKTVTKTTEYSTEEEVHSTRKTPREPSDDIPKYSSPSRKPEEPKHSRTPSPTKTVTKTTEYSTEENEYSTSKIRREPSDHTPKYSSPTRKPEEPKHSRTPSPTKTVTKITEYSTEENEYSARKTTREPSDDTPNFSSPARKPEKPKHSRTPSPPKTVTKTTEYSTEEEVHSTHKTPREPSDDIPKYSSPSRKPEELKHSRTPSPTKTVTKTIEYSTEEEVYSTRKIPPEPSDDTPKYSYPARKPEEPKHSRTPSPTKTVTKTTEYSTEENEYSTSKIRREPSDHTPKYSSPTRKPEEPKYSRTPSPTKTLTKKTEYSTEENKYSTSKIRREPSNQTPKYSSPSRKPEEPKHSRTPSPTKTVTKTTEYSTEEEVHSTRKTPREPSDDTPKYSSPSRKPEEPKHSRTPSPTKTVTKTTEYSTEEEVHSTRKTPREPSDDIPKYSSPSRKPEEPKHSRTPSPTKTVTKTTEYSTEENEYSTSKIPREPSDHNPKFPSSARKPEEPKHSRTPSPTKTVTKTTEYSTEENEYSTSKIPREPSDHTPKFPSSARKPEEPKHSRTPSPTKTVTKITEYSTEDEIYSTHKIPREPSDDTPKYSPARKPEEPKYSRAPSPTKTVTKTTEYSTEKNEYSTSKIRQEPSDHTPKHSSPSRKPEEPKHSRTPSPTKTVTKTTEYSTEENEYSTSKIPREPSDDIPKYSSPARKPEEPKHSRTPSPTKTVTKTTEYSTEEEVHSTRKTPREPSDDIPKYSSPSRKPEELKHSRTPSPTKTVTKTIEYSTEEEVYSTRKIPREPSDDTPKYSYPARKPEEPKHSRTPSPTKTVTKTTEYSTEENEYSTSKIRREPSDHTPKYSSPTRKPEEPKHSRTPSPTKTLTKKTEYSTEENKYSTSKIRREPSNQTPKYSSPSRKPEEPKHSRTPSPTKTVTKITEYSTEENEYSARKTTREPSDDTPNFSSPARKPEEPKHSRAPSPTKTVTKTTEYSTEEEVHSTRKTPREPSDDTPKYSPVRKPEESKRSRTPSPIKKVTETTEYSTEEIEYSTRKIRREPSDHTPKYSSPVRKPEEPKKLCTSSPSKTEPTKNLISRSEPEKSPTRKTPLKSSVIPSTKQPEKPSHVTYKEFNKLTNQTREFIKIEKDAEISDRVIKSSREPSHNRDRTSPSCDRIPENVGTSLHELDEPYSETTQVNKTIRTKDGSCKIFERKINTNDKPQERQMPTKLPSRNVSPTKKSGYVTPSNIDKSAETPTKTRSTSPRKAISTFERPQSPQTPKTSPLKPKEDTQTRKPTSPIKSEYTGTPKLKQNSFTKTTVIKNGSKILQSNKTTEQTHKSVNKEDSLSKIHKSSYKTKLKPEIKVSETSPAKSTRQTTSKIQKPSLREPQNKLTNKPKSATALNSSTDDDDVIIDVQQAKSSRENSPDRICPTPINFLDDVGTPRFPDEVSEPDDDLRKRTHHTIHETETIVDDIIEISEEDELFVKRTDVNLSTESDECLLSVNDKVSRFTNKGEPTNKPKNISLQVTQTEKQVHLDSVDQKLKSDECLLSVSEKVNKFTKGPRNTKDKSPSRNIADEYDKNTVYQDDYTKMSVNDKAHLFIETAEKVKVSKIKPSHKVDRPEFDDIDDSLRSDDCLLSVSDKVNKFVKTAEQFLTVSQETEDKEKKIREQHEKIMRKIVHDSDEEICEEEREVSKEILSDKKNLEPTHNKTKPKEGPLYVRTKEISSPKKPTEKAPVVKITTLRSSEAVKKAKTLFENIATTQNTKETMGKNITKLSDLGVVKKSAKTDSTVGHHTSVEDEFSQNVDSDNEADTHQILKDHPTTTRARSHESGREHEEKSQYGCPNRVTTQSLEFSRNNTPIQKTETAITTKTVLSRYSVGQRPSTPKQMHPEDEIPEKPQHNMPGYLRPTKTSQIRDDIKTTEDNEVSSRRGSGKFGVELRRTSVERSTASSERRRSVEHHQPCIEDIFDIDLLEQMLEKVVGYEQRRRIRAQIRIAKKGIESEQIDTNTYTKSVKHRTVSTPKSRSPDRQSKSFSQKAATPDRRTPISTPQKTSSPDRAPPKDVIKPVTNGQSKEVQYIGDKRQRTHSPEKPLPKPTQKMRSPARKLSPEKITKTKSPTKITSPKPKTNRFNEYATAYMKKVGLNELEKNKINETKIKKATDVEELRTEEVREHKIVETKSSSISKTHTERTSSKDIIEVEHSNGKRSSSPEKKQSPERKPQSPIDRLHQRSPSPDFKRPKTESCKKEIIRKTVYDIEKKIVPQQVQEEKPSWVTSRNLKKITSETRTFSNKKIETEKPKYRAPSPSKVITKPIDVITSSYGPGPLDADGRPLFGIKALRNGATNYQVRGTVVREEYHSRNGSAPQGSVSVTAYSSQPEELERLLAAQGERPSRLHGLAAITTTKKFGGDTGTTYTETHTKEERAALDHFTSSDRRVTESRVEDVMQYCTVRDVADTRTISDTSTEMRIEDVTEYKSVDSKRGQRKGDGESRGTVTSREQRSEDLRAKRGEKGDSKRGQTERVERREDKQNVRQSSVKSLTEKYIKSTSQAPRGDRAAYPKAGLILRSASLKDNVSSDSDTHAGVARSGSERSLCSDEGAAAGSGARPHERSTTTTTTTTTSHHRAGERSFLDSSTKVTGVQDILTRMRNADIVIEDGDTCEDSEARALLNKFLGATVLMAGMQGHVADQPAGKLLLAQESVRSSGGTATGSARSVQQVDVEQCWDERVLKKLLEECTDYEQRRQLRARIRTLMAEQEACATAVTEALAAAGEAAAGDDATGDAGGEAREETNVTITSSVRRDSSENTVSSSTTTKTSKVIESMPRSAPKPVSPFAKFRQLEKQNSTNSTNSKGPGSPRAPGTPTTPGAQSAPGSPASPVTGAYFRFTEPALQAGAATIKERLLQWCRDKTRDYENVRLENFSTSWADGLAFCALLHHFLPDAFDYSQLTPDQRRHNFTLAFTVADEKAGIYPLLDVEDMVAMRRPDWKCVFTYVQAIHRRFKDKN